jgi:hypothetical protein
MIGVPTRQLHAIFADDPQKEAEIDDAMRHGQSIDGAFDHAVAANGVLLGRKVKAMWIVESSLPAVEPQVVRIWGRVPRNIAADLNDYLASSWSKRPASDGGDREAGKMTAPSELSWITTGAFRNVLLIGDFAVKIARNEEGVLCNRREAERSPRDDRYCRVFGCFDDGRVLVMERADEIGDEDLKRMEREGSQELIELEHDPTRRLRVTEANGRNIGRRNGWLVYLDYGDE